LVTAVPKWVFDLFAQGKSPKVSVLEAEFSCRRHDSTIFHEIFSALSGQRGFFIIFNILVPQTPDASRL
jgi:hypothetical protein